MASTWKPGDPITACCVGDPPTRKRHVRLAASHLDYSAHLLETQGLTDEALEDAARGAWHLAEAQRIGGGEP